MDAKQKAEALVNKYYDELNKVNGIYIGITKQSKQCALIAVDEIVSAKYSCGCEESIVMNGKYETYVTYWKKVKEEIKQL